MQAANAKRWSKGYFTLQLRDNLPCTHETWKDKKECKLISRWFHRGQNTKLAGVSGAEEVLSFIASSFWRMIPHLVQVGFGC